MSIVPGGSLNVAATGVALGVTVVLSNQRTRTHCRLLLQARDRISVSHGSDSPAGSLLFAAPVCRLAAEFHCVD